MWWRSNQGSSLLFSFWSCCSLLESCGTSCIICYHESSSRYSKRLHQRSRLEPAWAHEYCRSMELMTGEGRHVWIGWSQCRLFTCFSTVYGNVRNWHALYVKFKSDSSAVPDSVYNGHFHVVFSRTKRNKLKPTTSNSSMFWRLIRCYQFVVSEFQ